MDQNLIFLWFLGTVHPIRLIRASTGHAEFAPK